MKQKWMKKLTALLLIYVMWAASVVTTAQVQNEDNPKYPDVSKGRGSGARGGDDEKMSSELRVLYAQYKGGNSKGSRGETDAVGNTFSARQLNDIFGIRNAAERNPMINIAVTTDANTTNAMLKQRGMKIYFRQGNTVFGAAAVMDLINLAGERSIAKIAATKSVKNPEIPKEEKLPSMSRGETNKSTTTTNTTTTKTFANEFNKGGMTGKGVIVGVIDTGIDWRHPDFLRPDGTSRILAIWDFFDESFKESGGKIGTSGPKLTDDGEALFGTIYTNAQINAALKNTGTVNTVDNNGHGTAVAGTAAGNGGKLGAKFAGVAPDADLIIVKGADCGGFSSAYLAGAYWITQMSKQLKRPVVINQSFGGHVTSHDGTEEEEMFLNSMTGKGIPGVIFTVAAGNEGRFSLHAASKFGPRRKGQEDIQGGSVTVNVPTNTSEDGSFVMGVFDARDEWGVIVKSLPGQTDFVDKNKKPLVFYLYKTGGQLKYQLADEMEKPEWFDKYMENTLKGVTLGEQNDVLPIFLPHGSYRLWGFGATEKVTNGNFSFYAPFYDEIDFGVGTTKTGMVGSPGNAANVITVGAYDFRGNWMNSEGGETMFNMTNGNISDYSNPGGVRLWDKVYKPDIAAPATYTISPLSQTSKPDSKACEGDNMGAGLGASYVTPDGLHIAWSGTSASSPFTAGVIALMLQKNPRLDAEQVRKILRQTATKGSTVGAVPNPEWGYGMLNPTAAIKATPLGKR